MTKRLILHWLIDKIYDTYSILTADEGEGRKKSLIAKKLEVIIAYVSEKIVHKVS